MRFGCIKHCPLSGEPLPRREPLIPVAYGAKDTGTSMMTTAPCEPPASRASSERIRVLVLGGAGEARLLAERIESDSRLAGVMSLAGRTRAPHAQSLPTRVGGFGGAEGLKTYLAAECFDKVVDATHPFAARIQANARLACAALGVPLIRLSRPPWRKMDGDRWVAAADTAAAAHLLGPAPRRVFLTIGRQGAGDFRVAPQHDYLLRAIDPPEPNDLPPRCEIVLARGPFERDDEIALMREARIDVIVTKNSGGAATYAKIEAARALGLDVVMIAPPLCEGVMVTHEIDEALAFLAASPPL